MQQKIADFINVIFGFRKFLILLAVYAIAIIFRVKGLINGDELVRLLEPTTIAFIGANGIEHITAAVKDHYADKNSAAAPQVSYETLVEPDGEKEDVS